MVPKTVLLDYVCCVCHMFGLLFSLILSSLKLNTFSCTNLHHWSFWWWPDSHVTLSDILCHIKSLCFPPSVANNYEPYSSLESGYHPKLHRCRGDNLSNYSIMAFIAPKPTGSGGPQSCNHNSWLTRVTYDSLIIITATQVHSHTQGNISCLVCRLWPCMMQE